MTPKPERILSLIHHNQSERDDLTALLETEDYRLTPFASAQSFCADPLFSASDCVVLCIDELDLEDLDAVVAILDLGREAAVVVVTGNTTLAGLLLDETPADFDVLLKPVSSATLIRAIQRAKPRKGGAAPRPAREG